MDEQGCPRCKTTTYRNPSLKLMVNVCGHSLCESCVEMLFVKGLGTCPECGTALRKNNFRFQILDNPQVDKEVDIRKRILKDFNKREDDFSTLRDYNDYLEMVETIIYNLANKVDVEKTKKLVEQYKRENKDIIRRNLSKLSADDEYLDQLIEEERELAVARRRLAAEEEQKEKTQKRRNVEALIDELMFSDLPAQRILETHKDLVTETETATSVPVIATKFSSGIQIGARGGYFPARPVETEQLYQYEPFLLEACGPCLLSADEVIAQGYVQHVCQKKGDALAGGYENFLASQRALHDAMNGLFFPERHVDFPE